MRPVRLIPLATLVFSLAAACAPAANGGDPGLFDSGVDESLVGHFDIPPLDSIGPTFDVARLDGPAGRHDAVAGDVVNHYDVAPSGDAPVCDAGPVCHPHPTGCVPAEVCNNGLDDNCNGMVDEGCPCVPGAVQRCFLGPPGSRHVGACSDGNQTCVGTGEFGTWGTCQGGISPTPESCNGLDNNCNGCLQDGLCCTQPGSCPGPGDPRIPSGAPYGMVALRGAQFGPGAMHYHWHIVGGPCDQMLFDTSMHLSYALNHAAGTTGGDTLDADGENVLLYPTLSGDYTTTLTITYPGGRTLVCTFIVPVRASGLRAELCWNTTGQDDIDFWMHDPRNTGDWGRFNFGSPTAPGNGDTCAYYNCRNVAFLAGSRVNWGYPDVPGASCREPDGTACHNPRLDIDNIVTPGIPENINLDRPNGSETVRLAVNYYGGSAHASPMVNVYCGGQLRATFGGYDLRAGGHIGATPVAPFDHSGANSSGTVWRVADVAMMGADACMVHAMHPAGMAAGYCVDTSTDRTYNGPCSVAP